MFACAAFCKESRIEFLDSTKPHRKSGGSPPLLLQRWKHGAEVKATLRGQLMPRCPIPRISRKVWWGQRTSCGFPYSRPPALPTRLFVVLPAVTNTNRGLIEKSFLIESRTRSHGWGRAVGNPGPSRCLRRVGSTTARTGTSPTADSPGRDVARTLCEFHCKGWGTPLTVAVAIGSGPHCYCRASRPRFSRWLR
jgi:hypothetical protein